MLKTFLPFGIVVAIGGVAIGGVAIYGIYKYLKNKDPNNDKLRKEAEYEAKVKFEGEKQRRFKELLDNKTVIENLTAKDLSAWFKEYKNDFSNEPKMIIAIPSDDILKGLLYPITEPLDKEKNILQWFYDTDNKKVLKIRLVSYQNIDTNFQTHLLENNGMIVVTE